MQATLVACVVDFPTAITSSARRSAVSQVGALGACEPEVTLAGGTYVDLSPTEAYVGGTMVSAKGWTALAAFIRECLKVLGMMLHKQPD